jgi:hypothetical protein
MKRIRWLLVVMLLVAAACGGASDDGADADQAVAAEEELDTTTTLLSPGVAVETTNVPATDETPPPPDDGDEPPVTSSILVFLEDGGQFDGLLTFDSVQREQTYQGVLTIGTLLPTDVAGESAAYRETVRRALESNDLVDEILRGDFQASQLQGEGKSQHTFGTGAVLTDGTTRLVFLGGTEAFTELYVFAPDATEDFPEDGTLISLDGFAVGFGSSADPGPIISVAIEGFPIGGDVDLTSDSFFWAHEVSGTPAILTGEMMDRLSIVSLETGTVAPGRLGIKLQPGSDPFGEASYQATASISVRDETGSFYAGSFGVIDGETIVNGSCFIGDCPGDGSWPGFDATLGDDGGIVFTFDFIDGSLNVTAEITIDDNPSSDNTPSTRLYLGGHRLPFSDEELDC